jgi:hypothetical protein
MNQSNQIKTNSKIKLAMVLAVFILGFILPYGLTVEASFSPLFVSMLVGCIPMFFIFIWVRKSFFNIPFDRKHVENFVKLLFWAFLFSSVFQTPLLLINRLATTPFSKPAQVISVEDSFSHRKYIHPPHLIFKMDNKVYKVRMTREQLKSFTPGRKISVVGIMGSLGYLVQASAR